MSTDKIILHWLNESRAKRIIWLLEELKVDYETKKYYRNKEFRAPKELEKVFPLGKSPVLEIKPADGGKSRIIAESGYIVEYLVENYDKEHRLIPDDEEGLHWYKYFLYYAEGTLQPLGVSLLINSIAKVKAPFGTKFLVSKIVGSLNDAYYLSELIKNLKFLEGHLKDRDYFAGNKLTGADILLSFPIADNIFNNPKRTEAMLGRKVDLGKEFPNLSKWTKRINEEPLQKKAVEIEIQFESANKL